ncbi:TPA: Sir2 family NAD-dependent protein deacetylase [Pseudomonas aeruginosa]|nr:Sir2 family NAD-dependent protein deacetylase [Pseudomonas aeruginosa]
MHDRAGSSPLVHVHGSLMDVKCFGCHRPAGAVQSVRFCT